MSVRRFNNDPPTGTRPVSGSPKIEGISSPGTGAQPTHAAPGSEPAHVLPRPVLQPPAQQERSAPRPPIRQNGLSQPSQNVDTPSRGDTPGVAGTVPAVNLRKGQKVDLTKNNPGVSKLLVGLGWDVNDSPGGADFDLDAAAFLLDANGRAPSEADFVFYNNVHDPYGAVRHTGDNCTGEGDGDDEQIIVDLRRIPDNIDKIAFTVTIYDALERGQNFGQVKNAYIRVVNPTNDDELLRFDLGKDFSIETAIVAGEVYRYNGQWKFNAVGAGFQGGLEALVRSYGLDT